MSKRCPLNMPPGSIRAILICMTTATICIQTVREVPVSNEFFALWAGMIAFYFGARYLEEKNN